MQSFPDMAEGHEWTLRRLREMAGRLTEQAYLRASEAQGPNGGQDEEAAGRWMLVFDRMARGLRLTIALEAKLARERRWDADEIEREAQGERHAPRWRTRAAPAFEIGAEAPAALPDSEPRESDRERDDDGLPDGAPLAHRIARPKAIVEGAGAAEPQARLHRFEQRALEGQRTQRARRAGADSPPDEPWDVLTAADRAEAQEAPWRGSG
jgi:hypothetical protein